MRLTPLNYLSYTNLAFHKSAKQDLELQPDNHFQLRSVPWKVRLQGQDPGSTRTKHQPPSSQESPTGSLCSRGRKAHQLTWAATQRGTPFPSTAKVTVFTPGTGRGGESAKEGCTEMQLSRVTRSLAHAVDFVTMGRTRKLLLATLDIGTLHLLKGRFKY